MKVLEIIILLVVFNGCCKEPKLLKNGLTKSATLVTETIIKVEYDTLGHELLDTVSIIEKFYNDENLILKRVENTIDDNECLTTDYIYDKSKKLKKEIVKMSYDTVAVNYFYRNSLLYKTTSMIVDSEYVFEQIENHKYSRENKIREVSTTQTVVDLQSSDTTLNKVVVNIYNSKELLKESKTTNSIQPERSKKFLYTYKCGRLVKSKEYNQKDSLISLTNFEYILDEFDNWIEKKSFKNNKLIFIRRRQIEYD